MQTAEMKFLLRVIECVQTWTETRTYLILQ